MTPAKRAEIREPCRHSASLRAFTPVFDGLWTRVNALTARRRRTRVNALTAHPRYAHQETDLAPLRGLFVLEVRKGPPESGPAPPPATPPPTARSTGRRARRPPRSTIPRAR